MIIPRRKPYFAPNSFYESARLFLSKGRGDETHKLEMELTKRLGIPNPIVISSGRIGLYLILQSLGLKKGSEIILPGYTFGLLTKFIKMAGFTPVPVDIDEQTFQMSPVSIEAAITKRTAAILATHLFGEPCDIKSIQKIAKRHKIILIEDCAESLGAKVNDKLTGTFGDIALSSFNIAKPLQGITGGLIFGNNKRIIKRVRNLISDMPSGFDATKKDVIRGLVGHIVSQTYFWPVLMYIFSFDSFRNLLVSSYRSQDNTKIASVNLPSYLAHITRLNLVEFTKRLNKRKRVKDLYIKYLGSYLYFQKSYPKTFSTNYMIVAKIDKDPLLLRRSLALKGIDIAIKDEVADNCLKKENSNVNKLSGKLVALPIYESLTGDKVRYIAKAFKNSV